MLSQPLSEYQLAIAPKHVISIDVEGTNYGFSSRINLCGVSVFTLTGSTYSFDFYNSYTEDQAPELNYFLSFHSDSIIIGHNVYAIDFPILKHYLSYEVLVRLYEKSIDTYYLNKILSAKHKIKGQGLLRLESLCQHNFNYGKIPIPKSQKRSNISDSKLREYNKRDTQLTFLLWHKMLLRGHIRLSETEELDLHSSAKSIVEQFYTPENYTGDECNILRDILFSKIKSTESIRLLNNCIQEEYNSPHKPVYLIRAYSESPLVCMIRMTCDHSEIIEESVWNGIFWQVSIQIQINSNYLVQILVKGMQNSESSINQSIWLKIELEDFVHSHRYIHYTHSPKVTVVKGLKKIKTTLIPRMIFERYEFYREFNIQRVNPISE